MEIQSHYLISEVTNALIPAKKIDYDTIVIEADGSTKNVRRTPLQIVKDSCLSNWSTYEGRKRAVVNYTNYRERVPIPINPLKEIIAFPTHGVKHYDCCWIMFNQVDFYDRVYINSTDQTKIIFKNNHELIFNMPVESFEKLMARTYVILDAIKRTYRSSRFLVR